MKYNDFPVLSTARLELRKVSIWDYEDMYDYASRPLTSRYLIWDPHPNTEHTKRYISMLIDKCKQGACYDWAIVLRSENKMIGTIGYVSIDDLNRRAEVGYVLSPDHWGRGYATEALRAVIGYGIQKIGLNRIEAKHVTQNTKSGNVMKKCGMTYEGTARQSMYIKGKYRDIDIYAILRDDYASVSQR